MYFGNLHNPRRVAFSVWILLLSGCAPRADYSRTREICDLAPEEFHVAAWNLSTGTLWEVTERCAERIGDDLGMDWESFGESPHAIVGPPESVADVVLLSAATIIGADLGAPDVLQERLQAPEWVFPTLFGLPPARDDAGSPMGERLYAYITSRFRSVNHEPGHGLALNYGGGDIVVAGDFDPLLVEQETYDTVNRAATLVHEAAHADRAGHIECTPEDDDVDLACDADGESGVTGAEALVYRAWMSAVALDDWGEAMACASSEFPRTCGKILDWDGFPPCDVEWYGVYCWP